MNPKLSIVIVTWNGVDYIRHCLRSVFDQSWLTTGHDFNVLIVDNGSDDETLAVVQEYAGDRVKIVTNKINQGFAKGYNQGIHWTNGDYILILNQDVMLDKNYLTEAVNFLDNYPEVGVVMGKVLRWDFANQRKTNIIDSLGLKLLANMQVVNIMEGEKDVGLNSEIKPVFGFSGSVFLARRLALNDVSYQQEFFDEDFFSYKEDVDLSWRLRYRNWDIVYLPTAIAYHKRSIRKIAAATDLETAKNYHAKPGFINYLSYRNHMYVLVKNLPLKIFYRFFYRIVWYEFKKFVYLLFRHPVLLKTWIELLKNYSTLRKKRLLIMKTRKINPKAFLMWLN